MNKKGITLIALIITIIILLILAGIIITMTLGENGLIEKSIFAKEKYENKELEEENQLAQVDYYIENYRNNEIDQKGINFSENETKTNDTWYGKPIYTKVIYINSLPNNTIVTYSHKIENIEDVWVDMQNSFIHTPVSDFRQSFAYVRSADLKATITLFNINKTHFSIETKTDRSSLKAYVVLRYTKTTD